MPTLSDLLKSKEHLKIFDKNVQINGTMMCQNEGIRPTSFGYTCSSDIAKTLMQKKGIKGSVDGIILFHL